MRSIALRNLAFDEPLQALGGFAAHEGVDRANWKIVLNFSVVELESILWLVHLSEQQNQIRVFVETPFAARVAHLLRHVEDRSITALLERVPARSAPPA